MLVGRRLIDFEEDVPGTEPSAPAIERGHRREGRCQEKSQRPSGPRPGQPFRSEEARDRQQRDGSMSQSLTRRARDTLSSSGGGLAYAQPPSLAAPPNLLASSRSRAARRAGQAEPRDVSPPAGSARARSSRPDRRSANVALLL
ncbi:hypothetical protein CDD83_4199 [Cordyceps sp. RAO-2017]|nr:hypothetical protein CDD83_4199 [Cordyceps sp. RAO-2017]